MVMQHGLIPQHVLAGTTEFSTDAMVKKIGKAEVEHEAIELQIKTTRFWLYLSPLTYMFLHAGLLHLVSNLWFFWIFADNVEERMGSSGFLAFYLLAGVAGGLLHLGLHTDSEAPLIGASGAVSGLMGAYIVLFPGNRITSYFCPVWFYIRRIDVPAWIVLGFFLLLQSFALWNSDIMASRVAFDAHIGGFVVGMLSGVIVRAIPANLPVSAESEPG